MDFGAKLLNLQKRTIEHREALLTEQAAKTALVMPFLQSLDYDVFNPSEVVPEFTADVGTKKGEKVDYAICSSGKVQILIECKPSSSGLNINHASQLFRYFSVTEARLAILTNGLEYEFYSDVEKPNKMDDRPFYTFRMDAIKPTDIKTLEKFTKHNFDIDKIVQEAGYLKVQSLLRQEVEKELAEPSEDFVRMMAARVHEGRVTPAVRENFSRMLGATIDLVIRDRVADRLSNALNASSPNSDLVDYPSDIENFDDDGIVTTEEEVSGFRIIQAIASKSVDPKRICIRDAKSYCAILLDDNNRKTIARLHFNSSSIKYVGTFSGKIENKNQISDLADIYAFSDLIENRIAELCGPQAGA